MYSPIDHIRFKSRGRFIVHVGVASTHFILSASFSLLLYLSIFRHSCREYYLSFRHSIANNANNDVDFVDNSTGIDENLYDWFIESNAREVCKKYVVK